MIELERHIEILLLSNDCVIVPGFGGFMAHHIEAHYDESDHVMLPPLRTIGFNPQLKINDSLLVQSYIEAYDLSYPEALHKIENEVSELRQQLESNGSYEMSDIGMLRMADEERYEFTPCEAGILTPELYGLNSIELTELHKASATATATEESHQQQSAKVVELKQQETASAQVTTTADDAEAPHVARTVSIKVSLLRNIAAACIAIIAFLLIPAPLANTTATQVAQSHIDTDLLYRIMPKDVVTGGNDIKLTAKATQPDAQTAAPKGTAAKPVAAKSQEESFYTLVLASRVTLKNATEYTHQLQSKGYKEASVYRNGKGTKVICGHYLTHADALQALNTLRANKEFAESWVMKVKNIE